MPWRDLHECLSFPKHTVSGFQTLLPGLSLPGVLEAMFRGLTRVGGRGALSQGGPRLVLRYVAEAITEDEGS